MPQYTTVEKTEMLLIYGECRRNARLSRRLYAQRFPNSRCPDHKEFALLVRNMQLYGSFVKPKRNRNRPVTSQANTNIVINLINENPHTSTNNISSISNISATSVRRILKRNHFHDFKMILVQELWPEDYERRLNFIAQMGVLEEEINNFRNMVLWSDECTFSNNGRVNRHNMHYWSRENPKWTRQRNFQRSFKVNVWCGFIGRYLVGPYFFEGTLNAERYLEFLQNELPLLLEAVPLEVRQMMWFQQDGAPAHTSRNVTTYLNNIFPNRWIGKFGPVAWPPRSPDLTPPDYFLWGYLKDFVYRTPLVDVEDLKNRIRVGCASIRGNVLASVVHNEMTKRFSLCIARNGGNFEQDL